MIELSTLLIQLKDQLKKHVKDNKSLEWEIDSDELDYRPGSCSPKHFVMASLAFCGSALSSLFFFSLRQNIISTNQNFAQQNKQVISAKMCHIYYIDFEVK